MWGGSDGNICIAVLNVVSRKKVAVGSENGIIGSLSGHRGAITGLVFGTDGLVLISASEDCTMRIWDTCSNCIIFRGLASLAVELLRSKTLFEDLCHKKALASCHSSFGLT
eukprot:TRINITY_DN17080_c0_g1_i4.p2 TRINITY_DN17080_c0_g1~~TRINITY_DN17080_c0_g1_i4.p2  ORF type:complete len:111 (+),score=12.17 TRINITY_DN17080_c0_g1_i4:609-941(+)